MPRVNGPDTGGPSCRSGYHERWRKPALAGLALLLWLVMLLPGWAGSATAPEQPGQGSPVYPALAVLADPEGRLNLEEVRAADAAGRFQPASNAFAGGYTRQVHWFRFRLDAPAPLSHAAPHRRLLLEVLPPYLDDIRLYLPRPGANGAFEEKVAGDLHPFGRRELPGRNFVFYVPFPDDQPQTLYLRLQTSSSSFLLLRAWNPPDFLHNHAREYALFGLYYGLMLALLVFNLWHGQWRQEPAYPPFIAHLGSLLLLLPAMNGLVSEYLLPDHPRIANAWVSYMVLVTVGLTAHFHRTILEIDRRQPWLNAYFLGITWLPLAATLTVPLSLFTETARVVLFLSMFSPLAGLFRAAQLLRQRREGSRFLVLAQLFSLAGYGYSLSALLGLTEGQQEQLYAIQLCALLSLLAFNAVLMSRLRQRHLYHEEAQKAAEQAQSAHLATQLAQQRQEALLSMLTHELKTPLGVLRLALDRLSGDATVLRHARTAVRDISDVVDRCMQVDLLDKGDISLQTAPCDLAALLTELREMTRDPGRVVLQLATPLPPLVSDPLLLRTILANLLDNALKYSPTGSPVSVSAAPETREGCPGLQVVVENLPGSAGHPDPERIYERYYRSPTAYARTGSGLGLFIARQLAERLGIQLRYIPGLEYEPVRFSCWIPCPS